MAGFQMYPLYLERYVLAARAETIAQGKPSITWQEVAKLPLCLLTPNMQSRRIIDSAFRLAGVTPHIQVETDSIFALYAYLRCSDLCTIVPHSVLSLIEMRQEISIVPISPLLSREIGLIVRKQDPYPPITAAALEMALQIPLQERFDRLANFQ